MKEREKKYPLWLRLTAFILAFTLLLSLTWLLGWLLMPQRKEYGSLWEQYLQEDRNSLDAVFFGSSVVYCDVAPAWIWEESGLRCWVMAGPEQTMSLTYYYIKEALKTQQPQMVVVEATALLFEKYQNYSRANISAMPLSISRLSAVFRAAEPAERKGLLFPLYNYHSRWTEAEWAQLEEHLRPSRDSMAGYTPLGRSLPQTQRINRDRVLVEETYRESIKWLGKIGKLCEGKGIRLLVYLSPTAARLPTEITERIGEDARKLEIEFWDLSDLAQELGIDYDCDWYDPLHFNIDGAEKFSRWWGNTLASEFAAKEETDALLWRLRLDELNERREALHNG